LENLAVIKVKVPKRAVSIPPPQKLDSFLFDEMARSAYIANRLTIDIYPRLKDMLNVALVKTYEKPAFKFTDNSRGSLISDSKKAIVLVNIIPTGVILRSIGIKKPIDFEEMEKDGFIKNAIEQANAFGFEYNNSEIIGKFSSFGVDFIDKQTGFFIHVVPNGTNVGRIMHLIRREIEKEEGAN
jgi:hypothetical protein